MKKHTLWLCLAAALLATSCSNDDEPVVENPPVVTDDDWISPDGQVVVQLGGYAPAMANTTVTRGTGDGPLDGTDAMTNKNIGVFDDILIAPQDSKFLWTISRFGRINKVKIFAPKILLKL